MPDQLCRTSTMPRFRILRRSILEVTTPPPAVIAEREKAKLDRETVHCLLKAQDIPGVLEAFSDGWWPLPKWLRGPGWYGVEQDAIITAKEVREDGRWFVVNFSDYLLTRILGNFIWFLTPEVTCELPDPIQLKDALLTERVIDPSHFFRKQEEQVFWEAIVARPDDQSPRMAYAKWLDERRDSDAWIFQADRPFNQHPFSNLTWQETASQIMPNGFNCKGQSIWNVCSQTQERRYVRYRFADGVRIPQFVAYLLLIMRIRHFPNQRDNLVDDAQLGSTGP